MSKQTSYKCDVTGSFISDEQAVPVTVKTIRANSDYGSQSRKTGLEESNSSRNARHVSQEVLDEHDFQTEDFNELEVIMLDRQVVGWRDFNPYVTTEPRVATDEQAKFLETLTYI